MPRGKYRPDYKRMYPGTEIAPEVMEVLKKSDRRMEYTEVERKRERFQVNMDACIARFLPSREDSYDRLLEYREFSNNEEGIEEKLVKCETIDQLIVCVSKLKSADRKFLRRRYWEQATQLEIAQETGVSHQAVSRLEMRVLGRLRKMMDK